jgi:hypothetical protein
VVIGTTFEGSSHMGIIRCDKEHLMDKFKAKVLEHEKGKLIASFKLGPHDGEL